MRKVWTKLCALPHIPTLAAVTLAWLALAAALPALGQNTNAHCTKETDQQVTSGNSGTLTFPDGCGTQTNSWEMVVAGGPATNSVTISGKMRGGTTTALTSSTSTSNVILTTTGGPFDSYTIAWTLTGGASPTLTFNRTATYAKSAPGGYAILPNAITGGPGNQVYRGGDLCLALAGAYLANPQGGTFWNGFTLNQPCPTASLNTLNAAALTVTGETNTILGCPLNWSLPLQLSVAASSPYPALGSLLMPPKMQYWGCGPGSVANSLQTVIRACSAINKPDPGCPAPQIHQFAVTSTILTNAGNRTFIGFNSSAMDIQPGEPVMITGGTNAANDGAFRICQQTAIANLLPDASCPANPSATVVYAPINSGLVSCTINAAGNTYSNPTVIFSAGGCLYPPTADLTQSGGALNACFVKSRGRGCTSNPTATITDPGGSGSAGSLNLAIETACTATCTGMLLHGSIPLIETVDSNGVVALASFGQGLHGITVDCREIAECVPFRSMTGNEHGTIEEVNFTGVVNRGFDVHTKLAANYDQFRSVRVVAGNAPNASVGVPATGTVNTSGTTITQQTGNTFNTSQWGQGTQIIINGVSYGINSVSNGTTLTTLTSAGTQTGVAYYVAGVDVGTEAGYFGDYGPHGMKDFTCDFSAASGIPTWGLRVDTNYNWLEMETGHCEGVQMGVMMGDANPTRGVGFVSWGGMPNANIVTTGPYQSGRSAAIDIRSEYYTTGGVTTGTTDYAFLNIVRNFASATSYTISDENPVGVGLSDGPHFMDTVTSLYTVDQAANGCESAFSSGQWGYNTNCGISAAPAAGGQFFGQFVGSAATATGGTASNVTLYGPFYLDKYLTSIANLRYPVAVPDNTADTYELALVGPCTPGGTCAKQLTTGSLAGTSLFPAVASRTQALSASGALAPGAYYLAFACGTGCTGQLLGAQGFFLTGKGTTAGTTVPAFITAPTNVAQAITAPAFVFTQ